MEIETQSAELLRFVELKFASIEKNISTLQSQADSSLRYQLAHRVTAIAGLKEALLSEHRLTRYIWMLLFCLGIGATAFYLYQTMDTYVERPTATTVKLSDDSAHQFLPLLICPRTWFDAEKAMNLGLSMDALKYSLSYLNKRFYLGIANASQARNEFLSVYASHKFDSLPDYYSYIATDIEPERIDGTSAAAFTCRGCAVDSKPEKTILDRDICYVFRLKPVEKAFGTYSGIRRLYIKFTDRTAGMVPFSPDWLVYFKHSNNTFLSFHPKVSARVFRHSTVKFHTHQFVFLNKPNAPCIKGEKQSTSFSMCMAVCHNEMYKNFINCGLMWLSLQSPKPSPIEICNYADKLPPKNYTLFEFFASEDNMRIDAEAADRCVKSCPRKCERIVYDTTLQMQARFTDEDAEMLEDTESSNVSYIKITLMHGAVFHGGITIFSEVPAYSFTQLVNNFGGTLGLFVGATVMTFAQLVLFVVDHAFRKLRTSSMNTLGKGMAVRNHDTDGGKCATEKY